MFLLWTKPALRQKQSYSEARRARCIHAVPRTASSVWYAGHGCSRITVVSVTLKESNATFVSFFSFRPSTCSVLALNLKPCACQNVVPLSCTLNAFPLWEWVSPRCPVDLQICLYSRQDLILDILTSQVIGIAGLNHHLIIADNTDTMLKTTQASDGWRLASESWKLCPISTMLTSLFSEYHSMKSLEDWVTVTDHYHTNYSAVTFPFDLSQYNSLSPSNIPNHDRWRGTSQTGATCACSALWESTCTQTSQWSVSWMPWFPDVLLCLFFHSKRNLSSYPPQHRKVIRFKM